MRTHRAIRIAPANDVGTFAETNGIAKQPEGDSRDTRVQHVLDHNVTGVLETNRARFKKREAELKTGRRERGLGG